MDFDTIDVERSTESELSWKRSLEPMSKHGSDGSDIDLWSDGSDVDLWSDGSDVDLWSDGSDVDLWSDPLSET